MKKPFCNPPYAVNLFTALFPNFYRLFLSLFFVLTGTYSSVNAQTIVTAAGTAVWTVSGTSNISEVTLTRGSTFHNDGFDGAMMINVTGTNITFTNSYHLSGTYGVGIQNIAITNTGGSASTFTLTSTGNLGSDNSTVWHYSSSSGSRYTISSDNATNTANGSDPVISLIYGNAALNSFTTSMPFTNLSDAASFTVSNVPIAAGQTRRFLILAGIGNIDDNLSNAPNQALLAVQNLTTGAWPADFTSFLTPTEKTQVMNWSALTTLPVTWLDFTAKLSNNNVKLNWSTASESNSKDFAIQHSTDANNWTEIGVLNAARNSNTVSTYSFIHANPSAGANYYRLVQHDIDGRSSYSKVVKIIIDNITGRWKIYQNPVTNGVLEIQLKESSLVSLYNNEGRLILRRQLAQGFQQLDISNYAKGLYYLEANGVTKTIAVQ